MADDSNSTKALSDFVPKNLKATDIPAADKVFLYIALQELKGNIITKSDWATMNSMSGSKYSALALKSAFAKVRLHAKHFVEEKGEAVRGADVDRAATKVKTSKSKGVSKRGSKKRKASETEVENDGDAGDEDVKTASKKSKQDNGVKAEED